MIDSNYNTEVLADLPEEQASQPIVKVFAARSKAKAKPQRRKLVDLPSIVPMNERKWIVIEPGESSFSAFEISKKVINLLRHSQTIQREDDDRYFIGRMIVGKHAQLEEEQKGYISTALIIQEQLFISELFTDIQDVISLILHYRKTSETGVSAPNAEDQSQFGYCSFSCFKPLVS